MSEKLLKRRWLDAGAYGRRWPERSARLLDLFTASEDMARQWTFSEYGRGPHAPFRAAVQAKHAFDVTGYDLRVWDADTQVVDLNDPGFSVRHTDVGVLSGVCEYLHRIEATLAILARHHSAFLLSYAAVPLTSLTSDRRYLQQIARRSAERGWRNHMTLPEIVAAIGTVGTIVRVSSWRGQTLFHVRGFASDA